MKMLRPPQYPVLQYPQENRIDATTCQTDLLYEIFSLALMIRYNQEHKSKTITFLWSPRCKESNTMHYRDGSLFDFRRIKPKSQSQPATDSQWWGRVQGRLCVRALREDAGRGPCQAAGDIPTEDAPGTLRLTRMEVQHLDTFADVILVLLPSPGCYWRLLHGNLQ